MKNIAVIGSGTMGNGIAHSFAQHGYTVTLIDIAEEALKKALATIDKNLSRQVEKGSITEDIKKQTLANITTQTDLKSGVSNVDLVVEAATENTELKLKIFQELDNSRYTSYKNELDKFTFEQFQDIFNDVVCHTEWQRNEFLC